jgi:hypothetical protein
VNVDIEKLEKVDALELYDDVFDLIDTELVREAVKHSDRDDTSEEYANRELVHAAHMYILGGKRKARGEGIDSYTQAAQFYPNKWGGKERGAELLTKLSARECYVRACALLIRELRRS